MKAMLHWQICVVLSLKFELSDLILKQLIKHLFHTFLLLFRFKSIYGSRISSKITKLYFILNIIQLPRGLKIIWNSVPLLNFPLEKKKNLQKRDERGGGGGGGDLWTHLGNYPHYLELRSQIPKSAPNADIMRIIAASKKCGLFLVPVPI